MLTTESTDPRNPRIFLTTTRIETVFDTPVSLCKLRPSFTSKHIYFAPCAALPSCNLMNLHIFRNHDKRTDDIATTKDEADLVVEVWEDPND